MIFNPVQSKMKQNIPVINVKTKVFLRKKERKIELKYAI